MKVDKTTVNKTVILNITTGTQEQGCQGVTQHP